MLVAIDGTSGSGKSTIAKLLARKLDFLILNTGLLYRMIAKYCIDHSINIEEENEVLSVMNYINYHRADENLHLEEISKVVPLIAKYGKVRSQVRTWQNNIVKDRNFIVEGRDIGSVVFPNAEFKFFINASLEERARRRFNQLTDETKNIEQIKEGLLLRDAHDKNRATSPLLVSKGSIEIDTTKKTIEEVVEVIFKAIKEKCPTIPST